MTVPASDEFRASFFEECEDLLEAMQDGFVRMVDGTDDEETIHTVFRAVHSIKGGAGAFGLNDLVGFAHKFESALEHVRSQRVAPTDELLLSFQQCGDHLADLVSAARNEACVDGEREADLLAQLMALTGDRLGTHEQSSEDEPIDDFVPLALDVAMLPDPSAEGHFGWRVSLRAEPELFASGNEPLHLIRALERHGTVSVQADVNSVPLLADLDANNCQITWTIDVQTDVAEDEIVDVFDFVLDCATIDIQPLSELDGVKGELGKGAPGADDVLEPEIQQATPSRAEQSNNAPQSAVTRETAPPSSGNVAPQTIRVDFEKVDNLINLVGELVIKEAMLSQSVANLDATRGNEVFRELDGLKQLASEIQEGVMAIRAQPIKPLFQRMARTVRDAGAMTGKKVRLVMKGESAEIDKTVLERLIDPLNHMVRNSVDHGLETTQDRLNAGKPSVGTIELSAAHRSGRVVIEITDDGAGIDRPKIKEIAEAKGLIAPDAPLTDAEIDALLFKPGFSSKTEVSELSGRGVGLDVVRNEISALGGRVSVSSEPGCGSTFSISLPLTLAVQEGMVVEVAGQTLVVPITAIRETLHASSAQIHSIGSEGRVLCMRESLLPIADLGALFGFRDHVADLEDRVFLIVESSADKPCALIVDALHDQRQVVIKSLETNYCQIDGVAAATILGDGRIALIVDPEGIVGGISQPDAANLPLPSPEHMEGVACGAV